MKFYKMSMNIIKDTQKVFDAFMEMENQPLAESHGWKEWLELRKTILGYSEELQEELREQASETIQGSGGWHRYLVDGNGNITFSSLHAERDEVERAKQLGFEIS